MAYSHEWTGSFARSALAPAVFVVGPGCRHAVREWVSTRPGPTVTAREPHGPVLTAWAVLDGGVLAVASRQPTDGALDAGLYVVGYGAFRLLTAELGMAAPARPLPGEPLYDLADLRAAHRARPPGCPDAREQAELLATCGDPGTLRRVATVLTTLTTAASTVRSRTLAG